MKKTVHTDRDKHTFDFTEARCDTWPETRDYLFSKGRHGLFESWIYRGHSNADWRISSTYERLVSDRVDPFFEGYYLFLENEAISEFKRAAHHHLSKDYLPENPQDKIEWLSILQHHGAPTRLIDITASPFVAAFFALSDFTALKQDSCIWAFNLVGLSEATSAILGTSDAEELDRIFRALPYNTEDAREVVAYHWPDKPMPRSLAQKSGFIYTLDKDFNFEKVLSKYKGIESSFEKIVIPKLGRDGLSEALKDLGFMNISYKTLFPGLDGYVRDIGISTFLKK